MLWGGYGRINRPTYFVGLAVVAVLWGIAIGLQIKIPGEVFAMIFAVPRLHDIGKSGWWAGVAILAEMIVVFGGLAFTGSGEAMDLWVNLAILGSACLYWGLLIWLGSIRGEPGANQYGEPPGPGVSFATYGKTKAT